MKMPHLPPAVPHLVLALVCIVVMVLIAGIRGAPPDSITSAQVDL